MKIFGNQKQRQEAAEQNRSEAKSVLLHTYFTSLMSLILCVSMFMGTSYAWFTSEVTNDGNEINVGILDVGLYKKTADGIVALTADADSAKLLDSSIRWEPGYTTIETIQIVNEGDLAFKYELSFTDGTITGDGTLAEVAKYFDVWVFDYISQDASKASPTSYAALSAEGSGWEKAGTLDELLAGKPVLQNKVMKTVRGESTAQVNDETTDGIATADTYKIAIHMNEAASSQSIIGKQITLKIKLVAYQMPSEQDAFGSSYDNIVTSAEDLQDALAKGDAILYTDIALQNADERLTMNGGKLDGSGKTITYYGGRVNDASVGVLTTTGGTITNLTIAGGDNGRALFMTNLASDLNVSNCTLSGAYAFNLSSADVTNHTMTFTNTTFKSWTSYANVMDSANFTNCTFEATLKPYGPTTLTNCTFTDATLDVSALENGETITLINCTYDNVKNVSAVVQRNDDSSITIKDVTIDGAAIDNAFTVGEEGYLVWTTTQG